jgi:hypothetical protein
MLRVCEVLLQMIRLRIGEEVFLAVVFNDGLLSMKITRRSNSTRKSLQQSRLPLRVIQPIGNEQRRYAA